MPEMSIGEVARKLGIQSSTIRYYESIGLLPVPKRISRQRRYDSDVLQQLGVIQMARRAGLGISEIRALLHDFSADTPASDRWKMMASKKLNDINALIERANAMKLVLEQVLQCQCGNLGECVEITENNGTEKLDITICCGV
jgi:MerR family redox-sensitive transcriptional activator SoxR